MKELFDISQKQDYKKMYKESRFNQHDLKEWFYVKELFRS